MDGAKTAWERVRKQGGTEGWIKQADISEDDGTPVKKIVYDRWDRFFTQIDLRKYGRYYCEKKDDFLKEFGLELKDKEKVSEVMKGHKELLYPAYYKKESEWLDSDAHTNALTRKYPMNRNAIKQERTDCEFWDGLKGRLTRECYYFNPKGFLNHLDRGAGIPEFNPYAGKKYSDIYNDDSMPEIVGNNITENGDSVVVDNPGFAPVWAARDGRNPNIDGYACVTGFFNEDYSEIYKDRYKNFYHEGVDFRGSVGTEIKSFIYGNVFAYGTFGSYGRVFFIVNRDKTGIFLLGHLNEYNKKVLDSGKVMPSDIVGKVGTSGSSDENGIDGKYNAHLHITFFKISDPEFTKFFIKGTNGQSITTGDGYNYGTVCNPFNCLSKKKPNIKQKP